MPRHKAVVSFLNVSKELQVEGGVLGPKLDDIFSGNDGVAASALDACWRGTLSRDNRDQFVALSLRRTTACRKEGPDLIARQSCNAALHIFD